MPEQIAIADFISQTWEDVNSPTTSTFVKKMGHCRNTVGAIEEELDTDRSELTKLKKSVRALYNSTNSTQKNRLNETVLLSTQNICLKLWVTRTTIKAWMSLNFGQISSLTTELAALEHLKTIHSPEHAQNQNDIAENLDRISKSTNYQNPDISASFKEFAVVTKALSSLIEDLSKSLHNSLQFPLELFLKGDIKGVKGDMRKSFDKAWKDYESRFTKLEKDTKKKATELGFHRGELTGGEIAEEMAKERKIFQLQLCMYLIKINEIKTKKGHDLLQYLMDYYRALKIFFEQGKSTVDNYQSFVDNLGQQLKDIKQAQHQERQKLQELQTALKNSMSGYIIKEPTATTSTPTGYSLHQLQGNKNHGSEKEGYLLKKSEGMLKKVWQKRKCRIKDGILSVSHSDETKPPVGLNLLTCQVKLVTDDPGKKCFDLVSSHGNRTYHFQADDELEMEKWISVLSNAKEDVLLKAFQDSGSSATMNQNVRELTSTITERIRNISGNKVCCDCGAPDPDWLSTNLGVLICLECCGIHRNLGVHISRTQSIKIDQLGTSQLLLARVIGNGNFNEILEARLTDSTLKPKPNSPMEEREEFIKAKYVHHKFVIQTCSDVEEQQQDLQTAIQTRDIQAILQVYAEGLDLMTVLPEAPNGETALHLAIAEEDGTSLPIVDFIIQNSSLNSLVRQTKDGNTSLHLSAQMNQTECMKLLLRTKPDIAHIKNNEGQTALDIATEKGYQLCAELLKAAMGGKKDVFEHINIEWDLIFDEPQDMVDYSEDEADNTPDRVKPRSRPSSLIGGELSSREVSPRDGVDIPPSRNRRISSECQTVWIQIGPILSGLIWVLTVYKCCQQTAQAVPGLAVNTNNNNFSFSQSAPSSAGILEPNSPVPAVPSRGVKKPSMPPPDVPKHFRNVSDPDKNAILMTHKRTPSEPPLRPPPLETSVRNTIHIPQNKSIFPLEPELKPAVPPRPRPASESKDPRVPESPPPIPVPRKPRKQGFRRGEALFDCDADNEDELTFREGEVIVLLREEEEEWWEGEVEGQPHRKGLFPISFVKPLPD